MTTISLFVQDRNGEHVEIDLDATWAEDDVMDEESFHAALVCRIALWALERNILFTDVSGLTVDADAGQELVITHGDGNTGWILEVVQLYMWLNSDSHYCEDEAILAYIDNVGWDRFDFESDLKTAEDEYRQEFDGDYEDFAKEWMDSMGESLDENLEYYFDYSGYGENLVDGYNKVSWGYREFLFDE